MQNYNFPKQNIQEGEKLNEFYPHDKIELPQQGKKLPMFLLQIISFKTNASLHSHYRNCQEEKNYEKSEEERMKMEMTQKFRPLKIRAQQQAERCREVGKEVKITGSKRQEVKTNLIIAV